MRLVVFVKKNIIFFLQKSMENWKTELTSCGETLRLIDNRQGIFREKASKGIEFEIKECGAEAREVV